MSDTLASIKQKLQSLGISTTTAGKYGEERLAELKSRLPRSEASYHEAEQDEVIPVKVAGLDELTITELRGRLAALGENSSTPGINGEERRLALMKRLTDAICGNSNAEEIEDTIEVLKEPARPVVAEYTDMPSSVYRRYPPPSSTPPAPVVIPKAKTPSPIKIPTPIPSPVKEEVPVFQVEIVGVQDGSSIDRLESTVVNQEEINVIKRQIKRLLNKRAIGIAACLSGAGQDKLLKDSEKRLCGVEVEYKRVSAPVSESMKKRGLSNSFSSMLVSSGAMMSKDKLLSRLNDMKVQLKEDNRLHRQRIKLEANDHEEYGVEAEEELKSLLKEASLSKGRTRRRIDQLKSLGSSHKTVVAPATAEAPIAQSVVDPPAMFEEENDEADRTQAALKAAKPPPRRQYPSNTSEFQFPSFTIDEPSATNVLPVEKHESNNDNGKPFKAFDATDFFGQNILSSSVLVAETTDKDNQDFGFVAERGEGKEPSNTLESMDSGGLGGGMEWDEDSSDGEEDYVRERTPYQSYVPPPTEPPAAKTCDPMRVAAGAKAVSPLKPLPQPLGSPVIAKKVDNHDHPLTEQLSSDGSSRPSSVTDRPSSERSRFVEALRRKHQEEMDAEEAEIRELGERKMQEKYMESSEQQEAVTDTAALDQQQLDVQYEDNEDEEDIDIEEKGSPIAEDYSYSAFKAKQKESNSHIGPSPLSVSSSTRTPTNGIDPSSPTLIANHSPNSDPHIPFSSPSQDHSKIRDLRIEAKKSEAKGDLEETESLYIEALEMDPTNINTLCNFAVFLNRKVGNLDRAHAFFKRAIQISIPSLMNELESPGKRSNNEHGPKTVPHSPPHPPTHKDAGQEDEESISIHTLVRLLCHYASFVTRANGDIDAATKIYQKALQLAPEDGYLLGQFAHFLAVEDRAKSGKGTHSPGSNATEAASAPSVPNIGDLYAAALKAEPHKVSHILGYAKFLRRSGQLGKAELMYSVALRQYTSTSTTGTSLPIHPENVKLEPTTICNYATFLYQQKKNVEAARIHFSDGVKRFPNHRGLLKNYRILLKKHPYVLDGLDEKAPERLILTAGKKKKPAVFSSSLQLKMQQFQLEDDIGDSDGNGEEGSDGVGERGVEASDGGSEDGHEFDAFPVSAEELNESSYVPYGNGREDSDDEEEGIADSSFLSHSLPQPQQEVPAQEMSYQQEDESPSPVKTSWDPKSDDSDEEKSQYDSEEENEDQPSTGLYEM